MPGPILVPLGRVPRDFSAYACDTAGVPSGRRSRPSDEDSLCQAL